MSHSVVIFGASGDLTSRKLIPALYTLFCKRRLPQNTRIIGFSRTPMSHDEWRAKLVETTPEHVGCDFKQETWDAFAKNIYYQPGDIDQPASFVQLKQTLAEIENGPAARVYYLATAPQFYGMAVTQLGAAGLADETQGTRRVVIEKPFGTDLGTAQQLNTTVHSVFREEQVYRIDHYLGKETVQNLLVFRFANTIFEPVWNRNYIDHVQITVAEEVTVGRRGDYYDNAGVLRDMFQNHLLQLMMVTAMEAPVRYQADPIRDEKVKVLDAVRPVTSAEIAHETIRGQYRGYTEEPGVALGSQTATYAAIKLWVDNWRWQGVPFYLRSGKAMSCRTTQIVIQFRQPPHMLFAQQSNEDIEANRLVIQVQPAEGIQIHFQTKTPDAGMDLRMTELDFQFQREFRSQVPEAYQRLLLDTIAGDASLFARSDEVEAAWRIIDPIIQGWHTSKLPRMLMYGRGYWGPDEATDWMYQQGREWFDTCPVLTGGKG